MSKRIIDLTRRQFLRGAGGFTLALPVLSSLLVDRAYGADPTFVRPPRLYWLTSNHGGASEAAFFPSEEVPGRARALFADHTVTARPLSATVTSGRRQLSTILQADSALLSERMVSKLNILRGLDIPFGIGHHSGGHLGNFAFNEALAGPAFEARQSPRPTIDQLLAWSPAFYAGASTPKERALVMGTHSISFGPTNPSRLALGSIQGVRGESSSLALFRRLFNADTSTHGQAAIVDRVLDSYKRLRDSERRLSAADRLRLDAHIDRLAELERKLYAFPSACGPIAIPDDDSAAHLSLDPSDAVRYAQLFNEVTATAFACGATRIAVLGLSDEQRFVDFAGDWHNQVAHEWLMPDRQALLSASYQRIFEAVFLDMAARLDRDSFEGASELDDTLMVWSQESGMSTHDPVSLPVVTAGGAAGYLNTGQYLDYRRVGHEDSRFDPQANGYLLYAGLLYNQLLSTALQAMGLSPQDFELWGHKGYGAPVVDPPDYGILPFARHYQDTSSRYFEIASEPLPFLRR